MIVGVQSLFFCYNLLSYHSDLDGLLGDTAPITQRDKLFKHVNYVPELFDISNDATTESLISRTAP